jgi:TolB-like protein
MADIFVSYARGDKPLVAPLVAALGAQGWSVWWDPSINPGQEFDRLISTELDAARAVIVVWTPTSVESRWVRGEAREGANRGVLVPVRFANARLPIDVRSLHTTDLDEWRGDSQSAAFQELARAIRALVEAPADPHAAGAAAIPYETPPIDRGRQGLTKRKAIALGGIAALLLLGALGFYAFKAHLLHRPSVATAASNPSDLRVAVLPFDVLSESPATHHFAEGLTDEIASTLSTNQMQTVSREDSLALRGAGRDETLARLNATLLFDGIVEERGADLHVRVHLDAANDHVILWSGDFSHPAQDSQTLETEAAARAGAIIQLALFAMSPASAPINSPTLAMQLKVADFLRNGDYGDLQAAIRARQLAQEVVARAPEFAWGHSSFAITLALACCGGMPGNDAAGQKLREQIRAEAQRALALDPKDAMAYFGLIALEASSHGRESVILKGLSVDPHPAIFVGGLYGREAQLLTGEGRVRDALRYWRQAATLDPLSSWESTGLAMTLAALGQLPESMTLFDRCLKLWPNEVGIRAQYLAVLEFYGAPKEALTAIGNPALRPPNLNAAATDASRAFIEARGNPTSASRARAARLIRLAAATGALAPDVAVPMLAELGDIEAAFGVLAEQAHPLRDTSFLFIPAAAKLRADPRFMALSAKLGHVDYWQSTGKWPDFCTEERLPYDCKTEAGRAAAVR